MLRIIGLVVSLGILQAPAVEGQLARFAGQVISDLRTQVDARTTLSLDIQAERPAVSIPERAAEIHAVAATLGLPAVSLSEVLSCPQESSRHSECRLPDPPAMLVRFGEPVVQGDSATLSFRVFGQSEPDTGVHSSWMKAVFERSGSGEWRLRNVVLLRET